MLRRTIIAAGALIGLIVMIWGILPDHPSKAEPADVATRSAVPVPAAAEPRELTEVDGADASNPGVAGNPPISTQTATTAERTQEHGTLAVVVLGLREVAKARLNVLTPVDVLQDVSDTARGANRNRIAAIKLRIIKIELRQFE